MKKLYSDNLSYRNLLRVALEKGVSLAPLMVISYSSECLMPFEDWRDNPKEGFNKRIVLKLPCRKCAPCLRVRRAKWTKRAMIELTRFSKCWFVTLTFRPSEQLIINYKAEKLTSFPSSSPDIKPPTMWQSLVKVSGEYITNFLKKIRNRGHKIKYIFVAEPHKSGLPHWHGLIYCENLKKLDIEQSWCFGFSSIKLTKDEKAVRYVTKYLSKDAACRLRASLKFGFITEQDKMNTTVGLSHSEALTPSLSELPNFSKGTDNGQI